MSEINFRFSIIIAFVSTVFIGCANTDGILKVEGKVVDESTNAGIPSKNMIIHGLVVVDNKFESIEVGQFSTDSSGSFSYTFQKVKDAHNYNFSMVGDSDYVFITRTLGLIELEQNAKSLSFSLIKLVDLSIKINRKSRTPVKDTLRLIWESDKVYYRSLYPYKISNYGKSDKSIGLSSNGDLIWIGGKVNSTVNTKVFADKITELTWELYRNGKRQEFIDTITCKRDFANIVYFSY